MWTMLSITATTILWALEVLKCLIKLEYFAHLFNSLQERIHFVFIRWYHGHFYIDISVQAELTYQNKIVLNPITSQPIVAYYTIHIVLLLFFKILPSEEMSGIYMYLCQITFHISTSRERNHEISQDFGQIYLTHYRQRPIRRNMILRST